MTSLGVSGPTPDLENLQEAVVDTGVDFPVTRDELIDEVGDYEIEIPGGQKALLSDVLYNMQADMFLDWDDLEGQLHAQWAEARWRG